jgi:hypothetical protein
MNLLILDGIEAIPPGRKSAYRGTSRIGPTYCGELPADHEINRLFRWYIDEGGETGVVHNLPNAIRFAHLCNSHMASNGHFEVIEAVGPADRKESDGRFIGVDLSEGFGNSLLQWGLKTFTGIHTLPPPIQEIANLLSRFYSPRLNSMGLFDVSEMASACLRSITAVQTLSPNIYEGGSLTRFRPVSIYLCE